ncbi:uncharacterized protein (DUF2147 family) [Aquabacterium commune]|uniref:Uncharacterized protein (DUF2147 family) n=1 Tax=Aquabacterium commune TaxID=70586 RepID=A0A4V3CWZ2_9BURK|nr:DUF2147 domain-containing protein [Aquabacterium commune]TDP88228.1 uncharacterized protein (DUF2147 family) [Aquabacterium commune]
MRASHPTFSNTAQTTSRTVQVRAPRGGLRSSAGSPIWRPLSAAFLPLLLSLVLLLGSQGTAWAQSTPAGEWQTIDDHSGKAVSHVVVKEVGKTLQGSITRILDPNKVNLQCEACEGPLRDAPFIGLTIIQGVGSVPTEPLTWEGGHILDPKSGRSYRVRLRLKDEGQTMEVRGYFGSPYFGRTQIWRRVTAP